MSRTSLVRAQGVRNGTEQRVTENYAATLAQNLYDKEKSDRIAADNTLQGNIDEVLDWIAAHGADFAALVGQVNTNTGKIATIEPAVDDLTDLYDAVDNYTYLANDIDSPPAPDVGVLFKFYNNTSSTVRTGFAVQIGDETFVYKFSEPIYARETRLCVVTETPKPDNGEIYVLSDKELRSLVNAAQTAADNANAGITTETANRIAADTALSGRITTAQNAIDVLNGGDTVSGSVDKKVKDAINAFATVITEDGTINTYKEVLDWIAEHGADFAALVGQVNTNVGNISTLRTDLTDEAAARASGDLWEITVLSGFWLDPTAVTPKDGKKITGMLVDCGLNPSSNSGYSSISAIAAAAKAANEYATEAEIRAAWSTGGEINE